MRRIGIAGVTGLRCVGCDGFEGWLLARGRCAGAALLFRDFVELGAPGECELQVEVCRTGSLGGLGVEVWTGGG